MTKKNETTIYKTEVKPKSKRQIKCLKVTKLDHSALKLSNHSNWFAFVPSI